MLRSDYCSDYERQKSEFQNSIATIVATTPFKTDLNGQSSTKASIRKRKSNSLSSLAPPFGGASGSRRLAARAQASPFGTKRQLAGRTLTQMLPAGGGLTVELWHKSETHIGAAVCSAAWGALCRCVRFCKPTAHPCRSAPHKRRVRPPWRREENRTINFTWVILFGHSKNKF